MAAREGAQQGLGTFEIILSRRCQNLKSVIVLAVEDAKAIGHSTLMPQHLALALLADEDPLMKQVRVQTDLKYKNVRKRLVRKERRELEARAKQMEEDEAYSEDIERQSFADMAGSSRQNTPSENSDTQSETETHELGVSPQLKAVLLEAEKLADRYADNAVEPVHLWLALLNDRNVETAQVWNPESLTEADAASRTLEYRETAEQALRSEKQRRKAAGRTFVCKAADLPKSASSYMTNLSKMAFEGKLDLQLGREAELSKLAECLGRKTKNSPCLIGPAGVGKTAIIEGLAQRIEDGVAPSTLQGKQIFSVNVGDLVSGSSWGNEVPEKIAKFIAPFKTRKDIILFFDEMHMMKGSALEIMKPAMARGEINFVGATTDCEYRREIAINPALDRRILPIRINEVSIEEAYKWLKTSIKSYANHHDVIFEDRALKLAVNLSTRHIKNRFLPDKAIDVLDQAASVARLQQAEGYRGCLDLHMRRLANGVEFDTAQWNNVPALSRKLAEEDEELQQQMKAFQTARKEKARASNATHTPLTIDESDIIGVISDMTEIPASKLAKEAEELQKQFEAAQAAHEGKVKADLNGSENNDKSIPEDKIEANLNGSENNDKSIPAVSSEVLNLQRELETSLVGQPEAIYEICGAFTTSTDARKDNDDNKPGHVNSLIFCGPERDSQYKVANTLASQMKKEFFSLDCSQYKTECDLSKLIGTRPGWFVKGQEGVLTAHVEQHPSSLLLLENIEEAHAKILNAGLEILTHKTLTDAKGYVVDLRDTFIVMTTKIENQRITTDVSKGYERVKDVVKAQMEIFFGMEFLEDVADTIIFLPGNAAAKDKVVADASRTKKRSTPGNRIKVAPRLRSAEPDSSDESYSSEDDAYGFSLFD